VKTVVAKLEEDLEVQMHPDTLKRFLKRMVIACGRFRKSLKQRQVAEERDAKGQLLNQVRQLY
jgi:hypothetical protein